MQRRRRDDDTFTFERATEFGYASLLTGLQYAVDELQKHLDEIRAKLAAIQGRPRLGRPPKAMATAADPLRGAAGRMGWSSDPEERKREMARRQAVAEAKRGGKPGPKPGTAKLHPRDAAHPGHAKWLKRTRAAAKRLWANMSPAERKSRTDNMTAARLQRHKPTVKLAAAS